MLGRRAVLVGDLLGVSGALTAAVRRWFWSWWVHHGRHVVLVNGRVVWPVLAAVVVAAVLLAVL